MIHYNKNILQELKCDVVYHETNVPISAIGSPSTNISHRKPQYQYQPWAAPWQGLSFSVSDFRAPVPTLSGTSLCSVIHLYLHPLFHLHPWLLFLSIEGHCLPASVWDADFVLPHPVSSTFKNYLLSCFPGKALLARFLFQCPDSWLAPCRSDLDLDTFETGVSSESIQWPEL